MSKTDSMTHLLKANAAPISAVKANKILLEMGLLMEKERTSSKDPTKVKRYKALTDKGLKYGINKENVNNPEETAPYYFSENFDELFALMKKHTKE